MTGKLANKVALVTGGRWDRSRLTGSIASIKGFPSFSVYNASKAAVRSFARSWIADLKGRAIRINVLSPAMSRRRTCPP
jgi:NAD(P)-dependent dehydrogenase (short-subunit alcohol dehydrogenase family)